MSGFEITASEAKEGIKPEIMDFLFGPNFDEISRNSADLVRSGSPEALYVPAVKLIVGATLNVLSLPDVAERLPQEVAARRSAALYAAEYATNLALTVDAFSHYYAKNSDLNNLAVRKGDALAIRDKTYLLSLGQAPFYDVSIVSGGAHRVIQENNISETPSDVIARSTGLLAISGVYKGHSRKAVNYLGNPYARSEHLALEGQENDPNVGFTPLANEFLRGLHEKGRGCPAGKIPSGASEGTLLEEYWGKIVTYLVPPDATTDWYTDKQVAWRLWNRL
jgi:hypothetical protein